jgi:hypothetical protein
MTTFLDRKSPSQEDFWRAVVLFGRNVASYKFALAKSLLELSGGKNELIKLEEIAGPYSSYICEHLKQANKQGTSHSSQFLDECRLFNAGEIDDKKLIDTTVRLGFVNVIDAFHIVNQGPLPVKFFIDERKPNHGIRLTDDFFRLVESDQHVGLPQEVEARWRLVETAWELNISRNLIAVTFDTEMKLLFTERAGGRRDITSCRDALNGYQRGWCFYCHGNISIVEGDEDLADVDHFHPYILAGEGVFPAPLIDGVWNLVLACKHCNRGEDGKFARVPKLHYLGNLDRRNNWFIESHHPLKETIIQQTGNDRPSRWKFLKNCWSEAKKSLIHEWEPPSRGSSPFGSNL